MKKLTTNQLIHSGPGQTFLINLETLGMVKEDLGKMFKTRHGEWAYFTGVAAQNWKKPMLYTTIHGGTYKTTIRLMQKYLEKGVIVDDNTHPDLA